MAEIRVVPSEHPLVNCVICMAFDEFSSIDKRLREGVRRGVFFRGGHGSPGRVFFPSLRAAASKRHSTPTHHIRPVSRSSVDFAIEWPDD